MLLQNDLKTLIRADLQGQVFSAKGLGGDFFEVSKGKPRIIMYDSPHDHIRLPSRAQYPMAAFLFSKAREFHEKLRDPISGCMCHFANLRMDALLSVVHHIMRCNFTQISIHEESIAKLVAAFRKLFPDDSKIRLNVYQHVASFLYFEKKAQNIVTLIDPGPMLWSYFDIGGSPAYIGSYDRRLKTPFADTSFYANSCPNLNDSLVFGYHDSGYAMACMENMFNAVRPFCYINNTLWGLVRSPFVKSAKTIYENLDEAFKGTLPLMKESDFWKHRNAIAFSNAYVAFFKILKALWDPQGIACWTIPFYSSSTAGEESIKLISGSSVQELEKDFNDCMHVLTEVMNAQDYSKLLVPSFIH